MTESLSPSPEHFEMMRGALDHIARTARNSRTSTRRLRWIERRATLAIGGTPYSDEAVVLPKSGGPNTAEKLQKRLAYVIWQRSELLAALERFELWADSQADAQSKGGHATFDLMALREERDAARAAIAKVMGERS